MSTTTHQPQAILITRVSSKDQEETGYSLQMQKKLLEEYALQKGIVIKQCFAIPESASGKQQRRLYKEMTDYRDSHPSITNILVEKVDRITRNMKDAVEMNDWLENDEKRQIHFVKQSLVVHNNSKSNEKFQWDIHIVLARQYSNNLSEEAKKGLLGKAEDGWFPLRQKRGYISVSTPSSGKRKVWIQDKTDASELPFIQRMFEYYDTGEYTLRSLSKKLFEEGWKDRKANPIGKTTLHSLLTDPFYAGKFDFKGKRYMGKHDPIITWEMFERTQERLERPLKNGKQRKHSFLFNKVAVCGECRRSVCGQRQKGNVYYRCSHYDPTCTQKSCPREDALDKSVGGLLNELIIEDKRTLEWVRKALKESHAQEIEYHEAAVGKLQHDYSKLQNRLDALYEDKLDGVITPDFYKRKAEEYRLQQEKNLQQTERHQRANVNYMKLGSYIFELAQNGAELYENAPTQAAKRELVTIVFSNLAIKDGKVLPDYKNGFELIAAKAKNGGWRGLVDDFQTANWVETVKYPEHLMQQIQRLLPAIQ